MTVNAERGVRAVARAGGRGSVPARSGSLGGRLLLTLIFLAIVVGGAYYGLWKTRPLNRDMTLVELPYWVGMGALCSAVGYLILSSLRVPKTLRVLLAAVVWAGTMAYQSHRALGDEFFAEESAKKAWVLMEQVSRGEHVGPQQVKTAQVGLLEPYLLQFVSLVAENDDLWLRHEAQWQQFPVKALLQPDALATPAQRGEVRQRMAAFLADVDGHQRTAMATLDRQSQEMEVAVKKMPRRFAAQATGPTDKMYRNMRADYTQLTDSERDLVVQSTALLDLLDRQAGRYTLVRQPSPHLEFGDEATLLEFRKASSRVTRAYDKVREFRSSRAEWLARSARRAQAAADAVQPAR